MVNQKPVDMCELFHTVLFAYQKSTKDILGSGEAVLIHPIIDKIISVTTNQNFSLGTEEHLEKNLEHFLEQMLKSGALKGINLEKIENKKYMFYVKGCRFSTHIHKFLSTTDTTCPFALAVMAVLQESTGKKVRPANSEYGKTGTKTIIEFLTPIKKEPTTANT